MPFFDFQLECPIHDSFRVQQVAGMFDLPIARTSVERFRVELPDSNENWQIGVIAGPSGSGKTAVARRAFGASFHEPSPWPDDRAVIDCFGDDRTIHQVTRMLTAVGLGSPPAWVKPYAVLSNGERFRCELAWALLNDNGEERGLQISNLQSEISNLKSTTWDPSLVVFDEYTSCVNRTVARLASAALARAVRVGRVAARRFVAVTCHEDVIPWLAPDWVLRMPEGSLARHAGSPPGTPPALPVIRLRIERASREMWTRFARHHYLSGHLHPAAKCFVARFEGEAAAFCAVLPFPHPRRPGWREHRLVCLPDFQGAGIGSALSEFVASLYVATGRPYFSTTGHPAMIRHRCASPRWRMLRSPRMVNPIHHREQHRTGMGRACSAGRLTAGFEYVGPPRPREARAMNVID
jgi:GNAT superfamily N-acetyltransferase